MQASTVKHKRLIGPAALALILGHCTLLFGFSKSGLISPVHANSMLPDLTLDESQRQAMALELAAKESPLALTAVLTDLSESPIQQTPLLSARAIELSKSLEQPALSVALYDKHASHGQVDPVNAYRDCARHMVSLKDTQRASDCYRVALSSNDDPNTEFELLQEMLPVLNRQSGEQDAVVQQLLDNESLSIDQLSNLAPAFLEVERLTEAYRIYARLALKQPEREAHWLSLAARWAEAANRPVDAAVFLDAQVKRVDEKEKPVLLKHVESLLIEAGRSNAAYLRLKARLAQETQNSDELRYAIELAQEMGDTTQAIVWNGQWLERRPSDTEALDLQVDLAMTDSNWSLASRSAQRLLRMRPDDTRTRERLARISEWGGQTGKAYEHWLWLSKTQNQRDTNKRLNALAEIVRLSPAHDDTANTTRALRELTLLTKPDNEQITELVKLYVEDGRAREASVALNDINIVHGPSAFTTRTLAEHEYLFGNFEKSLAAWDQFEADFGQSTLSTLSRIELLWRLDQKSDAFFASRDLNRGALLSQASDYQLRVLAEMAWQHRQPRLAEMVRPYIASLDQKDMRTRYGRRTVQALRSVGDDQEAIRESMKLWSSTGHKEFAISAMQLALKVGNQPVLEQFSPQQRQTAILHNTPEYWVQLAAVRLRDGDNAGARSAYARALNHDSESVDAASGLLWMDIGASNPAALQQRLERFTPLAKTSPNLWQAMAVGYLQLGAASTSVEWFDRSLDQIETDYAMLLTYADALEYAGRAADALTVREYTLQQLRPVLLDGTTQEQDLLLRQYAKLSSRYAGSSDSDTLASYLTTEHNGDASASSAESMWREDIAISWLMSTQQPEQARILMANLHSKRMQAPAWQQLALALNDNDQQAFDQMIQTTGPRSIGNHILALRQLGNDKQAFAMAQLAPTPGLVMSGASAGDVQIVSDQYAYLNEVMPSFVSGEVTTRQIDDLSTTERGFSFHHALTAQDLGIGLRMSQRTMDTDVYAVDGDEQLSDVALSLYFGNSLRGGYLTSGLMRSKELDIGYANSRLFQRSADQTREYALEFAYNERAEQSAELTLAGLQNRVSLSMDAGLGRLPFLRMQADAIRIKTREQRAHVANGLGGVIEMGLRGALGLHTWTTSVQAGQINYQRTDSLPEELQLGTQSTLDSVLARETQSLSVGASIARGIAGNPLTRHDSLNYYLNARLAQHWPARELGLQLGAGAGIRVLGGDELSFTMLHDTADNGRRGKDASTLGINYRYLF